MPDNPTRVWQVGALCRAVADALDARFNPVAVRGEISGFARASSGHVYFSIKDPTGQIRCVMFKRAFGLLDFPARDGELVDVRGRLGLYEPRGDLQLVVESMSRGGPGALFEQFVKLKAKLEAEGLFDASRKRPVSLMPRGIGVVTSLGAAALHDVISALRRRVPHVPVVVAAASVQGANAPGELSRALSALYQLALPTSTPDQIGHGMGSRKAQTMVLDTILLVRGGGAMEDLWAFNDESLARVITRSPIPVISGVGHETDFTIADFVADVRAPTPTAAAELAAQPRQAWLAALDVVQKRLGDALLRRLDTEGQRIDTASARLGRPSALAAVQRAGLAAISQRLQHGSRSMLLQKNQSMLRLGESFPLHVQRGLQHSQERLARAGLRLGLLDPSLVLRRGYAWLVDERGQTITSPSQVLAGQRVRATVAEGVMDLQVQPGI